MAQSKFSELFWGAEPDDRGDTFEIMYSRSETFMVMRFGISYDEYEEIKEFATNNNYTIIDDFKKWNEPKKEEKEGKPKKHGNKKKKKAKSNRKYRNSRGRQR